MTKTVSGWVLLFVGAFLLALGLVARFVGPGLAERTPLDINSNTYLTGQAKKLDPTTGTVDDVPVRVLSQTKADPKKSDDDVVVFVNYTCANIDRDNPADCLKASDDRLITNGVDTFASNRSTAEAVNGTKYLGSGAPAHSGLINKFPFDTQKKSYTIWDGLLGKAVPVKYAGTTKLDGLELYTFKLDVPTTTAKVAGDVEGTYATQKTLYIEPRTGSIVNQEQSEKRLLPDGSIVLDMSLKFTPDTVAKNVKDGKANVKQLTLISVWLPVIGIVVGLLALLAGLFLVLVLGGSRRTTA